MDGDWASGVAEAIMGDIPRSIHADWAEDLPDKVAAMLRIAASPQASGTDSQACISEVVAALPYYLSAQTAARTRAKLVGAALVAQALGAHHRTSPEAVLNGAEGQSM
jgi:hypothetical protein